MDEPATAVTSCLAPIDKTGLDGLIAKGKENPQAIKTLTCKTVAVGLHANAVARGITIQTLELSLEGDLNITAVWGTGDASEKPVGFTDVRIKVDMEADCRQSEIDALIEHVTQWSPVFNTFSRPVNMVAESV